MRKCLWISLVIIILSFLVSIWLYPQLPERMPSHWNAKGDVDGYMPKTWALFMLPIVNLGLLALFLIIPVIDPLKHNIRKFMRYYDGMVVLIIAFMTYVHILTLAYGLGVQFSMVLAMMPALGFLFYYMGILTENAKRNWFVGIRTPWTLSSEKVWNKTHKKGGKLFKASGVIAVIGVLFGDLAIWFVLVPVLLSTAYLVVYSYFEYRK